MPLFSKNLFPTSTLGTSPLTSFFEKFKLEAGFSRLYFCTSCLWNSVSKCWISEWEQTPPTQTFPTELFWCLSLSPANVTFRAQPSDPPSLSPVVDGHQLCMAAVPGEAKMCNSFWAKLWGWSIEGRKKSQNLWPADFRSKLCRLDWCPWPHL